MDHSFVDVLYTCAFYMLGNGGEAGELLTKTFLGIDPSEACTTTGEGARRNLFRLMMRLVTERRMLRPAVVDRGTTAGEGMHLQRREAPVLHNRGDAPAEEELTRAVRRLPPDVGAAIVLSDILGLSYDEIASLNDWSTGTVKKLLHEGRRMVGMVLFAGEETKGQISEQNASMS